MSFAAAGSLPVYSTRYQFHLVERISNLTRKQLEALMVDMATITHTGTYGWVVVCGAHS